MRAATGDQFRSGRLDPDRVLSDQDYPGNKHQDIGALTGDQFRNSRLDPDRVLSDQINQVTCIRIVELWQVISSGTVNWILTGLRVIRINQVTIHSLQLVKASGYRSFGQ